jgi:hypothetical protein
VNGPPNAGEHKAPLENSTVDGIEDPRPRSQHQRGPVAGGYRRDAPGYPLRMDG